LKSSPSSYVIYQVQENIITLNGFDNISKSHMYAYKNDINIKQYAYIAYHPSNPHPLISLYKHGKENGI